MTATTETRELGREDVTGPAPATTADDLRVALSGLAYHAPDLTDDPFLSALVRVLLPGVDRRLWDAYREAFDAVDDLMGEADPYRYTDANPEQVSPETARQVALTEWTQQRDEALEHLITLALGAC